MGVLLSLEGVEEQAIGMAAWEGLLGRYVRVWMAVLVLRVLVMRWREVGLERIDLAQVAGCLVPGGQVEDSVLENWGVELLSLLGCRQREV